ncbi:hypothetical protein EO244_01390 [Ancylomarina salipaludis]|uniref:Aromatic hydrocarbon degradation protein n=1 Tax=Ancylomarina salipaludis TaxID=2501299 RepID=A0A4Q1JRK2_9BACT|nr:hypothetical protein [Ancylomarina salipaludis]RXQ97570.1 hypothetical protein EO244_01390 [Ancylomarina salipaludis]
MCNIRMIVKPFYSTKKIIALLGISLLSLTNLVTAQNNTSSPYSYYGLGELSQSGSGNSISMGGTSLAYRNGGVLNIQNPAALAHIDSLKFIFNVGMAAKYTNLNQGDESDSFNDYNLTRLAFGFKVSSRYSTAFSVSPYSNLGYEITKREKVIGSETYLNRALKGSGGLNQLIWSNGVKVTKNLSLGINGIYLFGNNTRDEIITLESGSSYVYDNKTKLNSQGLYFNLGAQYQLNFGKYNFTLAAKYQPKLAVSAEQVIQVTNYSSGVGAVRYEDTDEGSFDVPESYGLGFGINRGKHLWIGGDYLHEKWSDTKVFNKDNNLRDRDKFSLGIEYKANDGYARKFFKKMTYRLGGFYDTGYITVEDEEIGAMGVSLGLGIPMAKNTGMINVALEFGFSGTTNNNMVREDFTRITVDINLFERWFVKRKYH